MPALEENIREGLIIQLANDIYETSSSPAYQQKTKELMQELLESMKKKASENTKKKLRKKLVEVLESFGSQLETALSQVDNRKRREEAYKSAVSRYCLSKSDDPISLSSIEKSVSELPELSAAINVLTERFRAAQEAQYKLNATLIGELATIAMNDGIEKALCRDTVNKTIRQLLPTPEDYRAHHEMRTNVMIEIFDELNKVYLSIVDVASDAAHVAGLFLGTIPLQFSKNVMIPHEIKRIYG